MAIQEYPKWMYGPNGESRIFNKDDQVPSGWADHPDKVKKSKAGSKPKDPPAGGKEPTDEERLETIKSIREAAESAGIQIELSDDASVEEINAAIDKVTAATPPTE